MILKLQEIEKLINSELSSKIKNSSIDNEELLIEIDENDLIDVVQFLKSNERCKFKQLIDIAGVDYPENEKRFTNREALEISNKQRHEKNMWQWILKRKPSDIRCSDKSRQYVWKK